MAGIKVKTADGTTEVNNVTTLQVSNGTLSEPSPGVAQVVITTTGTLSVSDKLYSFENFY